MFRSKKNQKTVKATGSTIEYVYGLPQSPTLMTGIAYPTGLTESYQYNTTSEMKLASGNIALPVVVRQTVNPGFRQPSIVTTYQYISADTSGHDYLGYGADVNYAPGQDALFSAPSNYKYTTAVNNGRTKRFYTYDRYHLLLDLTIINDQNQQMMAQTQYYYCNTSSSDSCANIDYKDLPDNYSYHCK